MKVWWWYVLSNTENKYYEPTSTNWKRMSHVIKKNLSEVMYHACIWILKTVKSLKTEILKV